MNAPGTSRNDFFNAAIFLAQVAPQVNKEDIADNAVKTFYQTMLYWINVTSLVGFREDMSVADAFAAPSICAFGHLSFFYCFLPILPIFWYDRVAQSFWPS